MKTFLLTSCTLLILFSHLNFAQGQIHYQWGKFTRADSLRGNLSPLRSCYDVTFYHLDISIDTLKKSISGFNLIKFKVINSFNKFQVDLFPNMKIREILFEDGTALKYRREFGAVFITFPKKLKKDSEHQITFYYSGKPRTALNPPWDGGFIWTYDKEGNPWIEVACQGVGASLWWPNKDHQSDKPDSMLLSVTIPQNLEDVSNGRLRSKIILPNGKVQYNWFISYPINNYDVTLNIGKYSHFSDLYTSGDGSKLTLDYYVMPQNLQKAKEHFKEVKRMLACYEKYFGKYPFYRDGYKLIESSYNGMEHQSAIAYGNHYLFGYEGRATSRVGLNFDFIIIHESAHEWWGNSVTSKDLADMWIHESFAAYAEALYIEYNWGRKSSLEYINAKKQNIKNEKPIIGPYNVNKEGSVDMYDKGQLILNTLRNVINNDSLWFSILKGIQYKFAYQAIDAKDIINYINKTTNTNYNYFFDQYLKYVKLPQLEVILTQKGDETSLKYKWNANVKNFKMPIKVTTSTDHFEFIYPTTAFQIIRLNNFNSKDFKIDKDEFLCDSKIQKYYIDPKSKIDIFQK
jgi:aminopeptidase N